MEPLTLAVIVAIWSVGTALVSMLKLESVLPAATVTLAGTLAND
ncbi:hypothetical protein OP10G_3022 [Fimbriimonas ginsengisoli Gsoil 348]|uniref:Uncharacterized protein n=1 Tax=Fimbriimonas ginsengisoli Gsoil 348 TaxID=661478 RepID=A0A068NUD5_FIMGI|nr:hypothetical protein OP10G_3022 [Fimbriimonas ginsengisoli Gsoil 348]